MNVETAQHMKSTNQLEVGTSARNPIQEHIPELLTAAAIGALSLCAIARPSLFKPISTLCTRAMAECRQIAATNSILPEIEISNPAAKSLSGCIELSRPANAECARAQLRHFMHMPLNERMLERLGSDKITVPSFIIDRIGMHPVPYNKIVLAQSEEAGVYNMAKNAVVDIYTGKSGGTGFLISENGLVATAAHVISQGEKLVPRVKVYLPNATSSLEARVVARDLVSDVAVLLLEESPGQLPRLRLGTGGGTHQSVNLYALGYPGASDALLAKGFATEGFSHLGVSKDAADFMKVIYDATDTPLTVSDLAPALLRAKMPCWPGFSGSPLLKKDGSVAGILIRGTADNDVSISASVEHLKAILEHGAAFNKDGWLEIKSCHDHFGNQVGLFSSKYVPYSTLLSGTAFLGAPALAWRADSRRVA